MSLPPSRWQKVQQDLLHHPKRWLVTGVAGFIGSNLLECLLKLNQQVVGIDSFPGDIRHSLADIAAARSLLGYKPTHTVAQGLNKALA